MQSDQSNSHKYDDIINLPHPISKKHPRMDEINRAAQFAPFAALTGYKETIEKINHDISIDTHDFRS